MKMESSFSLSSSSIPVRGSSQERELPPTQQPFPAATLDFTVSGNAESPPLGSNVSLAPPNSTVSGNAASPPLGSDLSFALLNSILFGTATSPPLDHSLIPPSKSQAGSSARELQSMKMGASSLSSSSIPAKHSSQDCQQSLPEATATSPSMSRDLFLVQPDPTLSGAAAFPPLGSGVSDSSSEDPFEPLNLPLTATPEFLKKIEAIMRQDHPCPHQSKCPGYSENTQTLTPPETPKKLEKPKAMNFPISKITIGQWTSTMVYPDDLKAKFYFAKKRLMWEILDDVETEPPVVRLKKKIEIQWPDVLSFRATFHSHDETGTLEVELGKRPTFFMETNPQARNHTKWKQLDQDFTQDQSASICRRHTLHFSAGVLQKNLEKLVSGDSFWSKLAKVAFPTLPRSLYFDFTPMVVTQGRSLGQANLMTGYGISNNSNPQAFNK